MRFFNWPFWAMTILWKKKPKMGEIDKKPNAMIVVPSLAGPILAFFI